jgi:hypothetical protein
MLLAAKGHTHVWGADPMLLEQELCFSVPPPRAIEPASDTSPPSTAALVQESVSTDHVKPTDSDIVVPASPASSKDRRDCFLDAIQKKPASPLLAAQTRPAVQPAPSKAPRRNSSRLTNNKLARIPISLRGEVLLMRRFDMEASELDGVFKAGLTGGFAEKILDSLPIRKASTSMAREGLLIV